MAKKKEDHLDAFSFPVEILSITVGEINKKPNVILTLRTNPKNQRQQTVLSFTAEQAVRISEDLYQLTQTSPSLKKAIVEINNRRANNAKKS